MLRRYRVGTPSWSAICRLSREPLIVCNIGKWRRKRLLTGVEFASHKVCLDRRHWVSVFNVYKNNQCAHGTLTALNPISVRPSDKCTATTFPTGRLRTPQPTQTDRLFTKTNQNRYRDSTEMQTSGNATTNVNKRDVYVHRRYGHAPN